MNLKNKNKQNNKKQTLGSTVQQYKPEGKRLMFSKHVWSVQVSNMLCVSAINWFFAFPLLFFLCCFLFLLLKISSAVLERRTVYFKLREWIISLPTTWPVLLFLCYHGLQFIQKVQDKIFVERSLVEVKLYVL